MKVPVQRGNGSRAAPKNILTNKMTRLMQRQNHYRHATVSLRHGAGTLFFVMAAALFSACGNNIITDSEGDPKAEGPTVRISIKGLVAGTDYGEAMRSGDDDAVDLTDDLCSRFDIAIYRDGERVIRDAQQAGDSDFGTLTAELEVGTAYQIVAIAHNCAKAMTTTDIAKITAEREVTDIFWAYELFTPSTDAELSMVLRRIVAKVRFNISETTPTDVTSMYFYYTGGSSTFNGETGYGSVNSKQNTTLTVPETAYSAASTYELFTIPRSDSESLSLTVKAFTDDQSIYKSGEYDDVPVRQNYITEYTGNFFTGTEEPEPDPDPDPSDTSSSFKIVTEWAGTLTYTY